MTDVQDYMDQLVARLADFDAESLGARLQNDGVVQLENLVPEDLRRTLLSEADQLLTSHGRRVDTQIASTGNTPRRYVSVARDSVIDHAPTMTQIYRDKELITFLSDLAKSNVICCPYEPEQIVVNRMSETGDTHGWHWDDYSYSFVWVLDAPDEGNGAQVEYIDGTSWDKDSPQVQYYLDTRPIQSLSLGDGSVYVLMGRRVLHRVSPLLNADTRKIICFTYAKEEEHDLPVDHGSMTDIYG